MSQFDIEVPSELFTSRFGIEASSELVTSPPDIEASRSDPGTSQFDIEASPPVRPMFGRRGAVAVKSTTVVRPVRPWVQQPYYGAVFDGVTLGAVIAANTVPTSWSIDVCWHWSDSSKARGLLGLLPIIRRPCSPAPTR